MSSLVKYDAACRALAEASKIDEVKDIRDKADAMRIYAMQAQNKSLEIDAAEIRIRAERRLGEMITEQKEAGNLNTGANISGAKPGKNDGSSAVVSHDRRPKLSDAGISKDLSSRAQKLAAIPEEQFEAEVAGWRDRVDKEGARVTTRLEQAGEKLLAKPAQDPVGDELTEARHTIIELANEVDELRDRLAVESLDVGEEEKTAAWDTIKELRQSVKNLEIENDALKSSRDTYMQKASEMQKQINYWRKIAEKVKS